MLVILFSGCSNKKEIEDLKKATQGLIDSCRGTATFTFRYGTWNREMTVTCQEDYTKIPKLLKADEGGT